MKDYKRHILWLDYFNSSLSREQGRRIPLDRSVREPKLDELTEAARRLGYKPEAEAAKHPKRMWAISGYVSVEKKSQVKKGNVITEVAKVLSNVRGERTAATTVTPSKGQQQKHPQSKQQQQQQKKR